MTYAVTDGFFLVTTITGCNRNALIGRAWQYVVSHTREQQRYEHHAMATPVMNDDACIKTPFSGNREQLKGKGG